MLAISKVCDWIARTDRNSFPKRPWNVSNRFSDVVTLDWFKFYSSFDQWVKSGRASSPVVHEVEEVVWDQIVKVRFDNDGHFVAVKRLVNVVLSLFFNCHAWNLAKISGCLQEEFLQLLFNLLEVLFNL